MHHIMDLLNNEKLLILNPIMEILILNLEFFLLKHLSFFHIQNENAFIYNLILELFLHVILWDFF